MKKTSAYKFEQLMYSIIVIITMATCIYRRACADRNTIRLVNQKGEDKNHIWTEYKCPNMVAPGSNACLECSKKYPNHKYQSNPKCNHGIVGESYPADSKVYGSEYYYSLIKKGLKIKEDDERRAKEAIRKAISEMPIKKTASSETIGSMSNTNSTSPISTVIPIKAPKQARNKRLTRNTTPIILNTPIISSYMQVPPITGTQVESMTPPLNITDIILVKIKKISIESNDYYFDSTSGKVYEIEKDGVGSYKGRYNSKAKILDLTYPDSDIE